MNLSESYKRRLKQLSGVILEMETKEKLPDGEVVTVDWQLYEKFESHGHGYYEASFIGKGNDGSFWQASGVYVEHQGIESVEHQELIRTAEQQRQFSRDRERISNIADAVKTYLNYHKEAKYTNNNVFNRWLRMSPLVKGLLELIPEEQVVPRRALEKIGRESNTDHTHYISSIVLKLPIEKALQVPDLLK